MVKRYGRLGSWEPPTPGASKQITSMAGSSASTNGCQASSRMPMPLHSRSGGPVPVPGRIATRSGVPAACVICSRTESSLTVMSIPPRARHGYRPVTEVT